MAFCDRKNMFPLRLRLVFGGFAANMVGRGGRSLPLGFLGGAPTEVDTGRVWQGRRTEEGGEAEGRVFWDAQMGRMGSLFGEKSLHFLFFEVDSPRLFHALPSGPLFGPLSRGRGILALWDEFGDPFR